LRRDDPPLVDPGHAAQNCPAGRRTRRVQYRRNARCDPPGSPLRDVPPSFGGLKACARGGLGCSCASTTRLAVPPSVARWWATKTQSPVKSCESRLLPIVQLSRLLRRFHDCSMTFVRYNLLQMIVLSHICLRAERQYQAGGYGGPPAQDRQSLRIHWPGAQRTAPGVDVTKDLKGTYGANKGWTIISRKIRSTRTNKSSSALSAGSLPGWPREASRLHRERLADEDHRSEQRASSTGLLVEYTRRFMSSCRPARIVSDASSYDMLRER
jgi:hypothetical protein